MADDRGSPEDRINQALEDKDLPQVYANGFSLNLGTGDVLIVAERNGRPAAIINASYTVAKTLAQKLNHVVAILEDKTGNSIMTTEQVNHGLADGEGSDDVTE